MLRADMLKAAAEVFPEEEEEINPLEEERAMHQAFIERRGRIHIGRLEEKRKLSEHVQSEDRRIAVISGKSGIGKSAFLASWRRELFKLLYFWELQSINGLQN